MTEANISWLTDQVATGGDFSFNKSKATRQFWELHDMGLDLVIDCRAEADDRELWSLAGVEYLHLPAEDLVGGALPDEHFDKAVEAALPVIESGGKVFVHCHMGINRGPSTAMAVLLALGHAPAAAFDLIRRKRPEAGIAFADDALRAHLLREGASMKMVAYRVTQLRDHIRKVMTKEQRAKIRHIMRSNHERDHAEIMGLQ